jgi:AcrR family transcriptional regulator
MSIARERLSHDESRSRALEAARAILLENGPQAVTLKAVSARMERSHANLLHHFGSAAELQKALAASMAAQVCTAIAEAVEQARAGHGSARRIVDLAFDAFGRDGAGALAVWMLMTGNDSALDPVLAAIHDLVQRLAPGAHGEIERETLALILMALGHALLGRPMADALGVDHDAAREIACERLERLFEEPASETG